MNTRRFGRLAARPAVADDAAFLEALYLAARPDLGALPVPRGVIEAIARHQRRMQLADYARRFPGHADWLVEEEGVPLARLVLHRDGDVLRVVDLSVAASARRRGIARTLLAALQHECGEAGTAHTVALRVRADNAPARALYEALGFTLARADGATLEMAWRGGSRDRQNE